MIQGSLYPGWCRVPSLPTYSWKSHQKEPPHKSHRVRGGPRKKMRGGDANELGEVPHKQALERFS
jgi:hypothetical protein